MHPHLIDWLRNTEIAPDAATATRRWRIAKKLKEKVDRPGVIELLRAFTLPRPDKASIKKLTDEFLSFDQEFPVTNNSELVRVMAGVVMVASFADASVKSDAFSLGLRAASFQGRRGPPAQAEIVKEAEDYLAKEAARMRANDFSHDIDSSEQGLASAYDLMRTAESAGDEAQAQSARAAYQKAVSDAISDADQVLADRIARLAEESAMLWWVLGEFSDQLDRRISSLSASEFALIAAAEAAERTQLLPPPPSIDALLSKAIHGCKSGVNKRSPFKEYLLNSNEDWRARQIDKLNFRDCIDLVPITASLQKMVESDDADAVSKMLPRLCPGVAAEIVMTPVDAARQFYAELIFLRALDKI
jgi:hypothetical protein